MPGPLALAAIGAGASIVQNGGNALFTAMNNRKMRKWQEGMYNTQRRDALADWERQNQYDSPQAQMQRYKDAGLSPHLIYGQMGQGASIRSSDAGSYRPNAPEIDIQGMIMPLIMSIYDIANKQASTQLLEAQAKSQSVANMEAAKRMQGMDVSRAMMEFDLTQKSRLADTAAAQAQANLESTRANTAYTTHQDARAEIAQAKSLEEATARILTMAATRAKTYQEVKQLRELIKQLPYDLSIKKKHAQMWENNVNPNDPAWQRQVLNWITTYIEGSKLSDKLKDDIIRDWKPYTPSWQR